VKIQVADPTPLGVFGLAIVTLVAASQKLGITTGLGLVLPWAIFLGGFAQLIACVIDFKHNNLFGSTAFGAYGLFWLGVAASWLAGPLKFFGDAIGASADGRQLGFVFLGYLFITVMFTISSLKMTKTMFLLLSLICVLFVGLALFSFGMGKGWNALAGYAELATSLTGFYFMAGKYLNSFFGKEILPLGKAFI
jgi:succinate-acetate transporter protein